MLHAAVLRSLRLSGRQDLIDEQLSQAYHVWFAMKCLREHSRAGRADSSQLASRLKGLSQASPCKGNALLHRVIAEIGGRGVTVPATGPTAAASQTVAEPPVSSVSYDDVVSALSGGSAEFKSDRPVVLESLTAEQFERLIRMADPANDPNRGTRGLSSIGSIHAERSCRCSAACDLHQ